MAAATSGIFVFVLCLCLVSCDLNLQEDEPCVTDGLNGTCVGVFRCPSASLTYLYANAGFPKEKNNYPELPDICSYKNNEPVVCCTECNVSDAERYRNTAIGPLATLTDTKSSVAWSKCLDYFHRLPYPCRGQGNFEVKKIWKEDKKCHEYMINIALVVGGRRAQRWEFPHMALLGYGDNEQTAQWLCGGTVISERFILTAAHCIFTRALINFAKNLLPACLDIGEESPRRAEASGWGRLGHMMGLADTLQVVNLQQFEETECAALFPPHRHLKHGYDHEKQMCYGNHKEIVDTCEGDSGGPLQTNQFKCQYTVVGVTSFGKDCGILGSAGMYTRVSYYVPWIESIVWPEETEERRNQDNLWLDRWLNITP